jgi:hypothetical protein
MMVTSAGTTTATNSNNNMKLNKRRYNVYIPISIILGVSILRLLGVYDLRMNPTSLSSWWNTTTTTKTTTTTTEIRTNLYNKDNCMIEKKNDPYHLDLTNLPLLDWELESLVNRTCNTPPRQQLPQQQQQQQSDQNNIIPSYCCLGSLSAGGGVFFAQDQCNKGIEIYNRTQTLALLELQKNPIVTKKTRTNVDHNNHNRYTETCQENDNIIQCDVCRIVDILMEQNWTLAFQGDSITRQTFFGLECELYRRGYIVMNEQIYTAQSKASWRIGLDEVLELHIYKQQQAQVPVVKQNDQYATIRLYAMYRPNIVDTVEIQNIVMNNDIIMFDHGLHYGVISDPCFADQMVSLLETYIQYFNQYHNAALLIWRETSAQHFNNSMDGYFIPGVADTTCAPPVTINHDEEGDNTDYNNSNADTNTNRIMKMMQGILQKDPKIASKLKIIPFYEYTKQLYDLHVDGDCSHFCSSPALFLPLYRLLRNAMENVL